MELVVAVVVWFALACVVGSVVGKAIERGTGHALAAIAAMK